MGKRWLTRAFSRQRLRSLRSLRVRLNRMPLGGLHTKSAGKHW